MASLGRKNMVVFCDAGFLYQKKPKE
nr:hypothetical protein [Candidatus Baldrarchaeota archaeon]